MKEVLYAVGFVICMGLVCASFGVQSEEDVAKKRHYSLLVAGRNRLKSQLRDPGSLQIIREEIRNEGTEQPSYYARYRAKNAFGGYVIDEYITY